MKNKSLKPLAKRQMNIFVILRQESISFLSFRKDFLSQTPKAQNIKEKMNKCDYIQTKFEYKKKHQKPSQIKDMDWKMRGNHYRQWFTTMQKTSINEKDEQSNRKMGKDVQRCPGGIWDQKHLGWKQRFGL